MKLNRCVLVLVMKLAAVMVVQSALVYYHDPEVNKEAYYQGEGGSFCTFYCRVRTDNNETLENLPTVKWFRKNYAEVFQDLYEYLIEQEIHVQIGRPLCKTSKNLPGVYICDVEVRSCHTRQFGGDYRCQVESTYPEYSSVSTQFEIHFPLDDPFDSECFLPVAENLTVSEILGSSLSVNFTWDATKKAPHEKYCTGSRRWEIKISSLPNPNSITDKRPTSSSSGFFSEDTVDDRTDTSVVFHNLSRRLYYLFEVRNKKLQRDTIGKTNDEIYRYASYIYYFGEQEYPVIRVPHEERTIKRVNEGSVLALVCVGVGKPAPRVAFRRPRDEGYLSDFSSSSPTQHDSDHYSLVDVQPNQAGEYVCELTSTLVNPPIGKRLITRIKRYIVIVEPPLNQTTNIPVTTGLRCTSLATSTCSAYVLRDVDIFFNSTDGNTNAILKALAESHRISIQSLNISSNDKCIPFLEAVMCHTLFPYCDRTTGIPSPRPICKSTCDIFSPDGPCGHLFEDQPNLYDMLSSGCDTRVNPAGSTPECIHVSLDYPKNAEEKIRGSWCSKGSGRNYDGEVTHTRDGHQCQSWLQMDPHSHPLSTAEFPYELSNARHYCRNPGGLGEQPWCYTTNTSVRWDYCEVPQCDVCEEYSGDFCRDLPLYNTRSAGVFYQREAIQVFVADTLEARMNLVFNQLGGANLAGGCQLALRQLLCHIVVPLCKMQVDPAPKTACSDHCQLVEVLCHCLQVDVIEYLKESMIHSSLTLPSCPGEPEADNDEECAPSPEGIPPPQGNSTQDCYTAADYGHSYTGNVTVTVSGLTCIAWDSNNTHTHVFKSTEYPELIEAENYCRNPGKILNKPWCFTTDNPLTWEYCDLPSCVQSEVTSEPNIPTTVAAEPQNGNNVMTIVPVIVTVLGALILVIVVVVSNCICYGYRKKANELKSLAPISPTLEQYRIDSGQSEIKFTFNDQYVLTQALATKVAETIKTFQQYDRKNIKYIKQIGQGNFGIVYLGRAVDLVDGEEDTLVAVKTLKEETSHESLEEFVREAKIMLSFDHPNIIKLHGVCMQDLPYCLIFEYMNRGDLAAFLRENASSVQRRFMSCDRPRSRTESTLSDDPPSLDTEQLTDICKQVAAGMEYLSVRNHVHRDLACRNCLVKMEETMDNDGEVTTLGNIIIKIGDFGMSHNLYSHNYYRVRGQAILPIRWMAPESIIYGKFTTAADVWSFGVVMWEVFSFGLQPYYGTSNDEVTDAVRRGKNLSQPNNCPRKMYQIMKDCWNMEQDLRPTFTELHNILNEARSSVSSYSDDGSSCRSSSPTSSDESSEVSDDAFLEENSIVDLKVEDSMV